MRFFKKKMSRAEAIAKAIDMSDDGDSVTLHAADCTDPNICTCQPRMLYIGERASPNPLGFRIRRDD
jgi:hypothetical protein